MTQATKIVDGFPAQTRSHHEQAWGGAPMRRHQSDEQARIRDELGKVRTDWKSPPRARAARLARASHFQSSFDFAIETCVRIGELTSLKWGDIDPKRRLWLVPPARQLSRARNVYLTPRALEILQELWRPGTSASDRVFDKLPSAAAVAKALEKAVRLLSIGNPKFSDLKHEGVCRHLEAGLLSLMVLMKMAGYSESSAMAALYSFPSDAEILARMQWALLSKHLPASTPAALETQSAGRLRRPLTMMDANELDVGDDPALMQARVAAQLRECLEPTRKQPLRL